MTDTPDPRLTPLAASLPATVPFTGPEALERRQGTTFAARLGANESAFGPSPAVLRALADTASHIWKYADPEAHNLRTAIAAHHGIDPAHIAVGEGIDGLLGLIVRLTVAPGDVAVTSRGAYPTFAYHVAGFGGTLATVPYAGDWEDPERLIAKARETQAKLVYFANPDNPMGTWHSADTVERMIDAVPPHALLLLDEAYIDLAPPGTAPAIDPADARVLRLRTFSKAYGLAGARVGYAIGPAPLIAAFDAVKNHFGLGRMAQAAALAALGDADWLAQAVARTATSRESLAGIARDNGLTPIASATNFVTMDTGRDGAFAGALLAALARHGVFARMPGVAPLDRCIRLTCGLPADLEVLARALPPALSEATVAGPD